MGSSRRLRAKGEGTFLEMVKVLLTDLKAEVAQVQESIAEIKACYVGGYSNHDAWVAAPMTMGSWQVLSDWFAADSQNVLGVSATPGPGMFNLNANAEEFTPSAKVSRERMLQYRPCRDGCSKPDELIGFGMHCRTCQQAHDQCICAEVYCRHCFRVASTCECTEPLLKARRCGTCHNWEDNFSIFDADFVCPKVLPKDFECLSCGAWEYEDDDAYYLVQSAHACTECFSLLGQASIRPCDGKGCIATGLFHEGCMEKIFQEAAGEQKFLCRSCMEVGNPIDTETDVEDIESEEEGLDSKRLDSEVQEMSQPDSGEPPVDTVIIGETQGENEDQATDNIVNTTGAVDRGNLENSSLENLGARLNYMMLFLEGHHAKSEQASEKEKALVLNSVKRTMKWRAVNHSSAEIDKKVEELDALMMAVIKRLTGGSDKA